MIECSKLYPALCFDMHGSPGFHNVYVGLLVICSGIWMVYRLSKIVEFYEMVRIIQEEGKVINIPSLGPYASELKKLTRVHISQIIRERCSISPTTVKKVHVMSIMEESTLKTRLIPNPSSSSSPDESYSLEVSFKVDSMVPYSVQLFWGVDYLGARELLNSGRKGGELVKGANVVGDKDSRRMALGSSKAMYDSVKCREEFGQKVAQREHGLGNTSPINDSESYLAESRGVFKNMEMESGGRDSVDESGRHYQLDFSPSESIKSIAYANPILFTTEMSNKKDQLRSLGGIGESYFDYRDNLSGREGLSIGSKITRALRKVRDGLGRNAVTEYIGDSLNYSGWNSSLLGDNAIILGKAVKRLFERVFFYDLTFSNSGSSANYMNNSMLGHHMGLNLTASSLLSSASATTESLLESSRNGTTLQGGSHYKNKRSNEYHANFNLGRVESHSRFIIDEIKDQVLIDDRLDAMHKTEKKYFEKGLSQEFCERIKLTPEYLSLCNLSSPYDDDTCDHDHDHDHDQNQNRDHYYLSGNYYEIQEKCKDKDSVWSRRFFENNNGNSESVAVKEGSRAENASESRKNSPRVPLLILVRANVATLQDESVLSNHIIAVHFDLIQDHYNIPYLMYKPLILKQVVSNSFGHLVEPYDIFGMEDDELDCLICMSNPKDVVLLPCRHCISCESCLRSLRQDKCPLCRTTFYGFAVLPIKSS